MDVLLPRHSQLHLGYNRGDPINHLHLPHPHTCCEEGKGSAQSTVLAAGGASSHSEGLAAVLTNLATAAPGEP